MVAGSIYLKRDRYYWKVRFPGEDKARTVALKPVGSQQATKNRKVAEEVAKILWKKAATDGKSGSKDRRICSLIAKYSEYAKGYYCENEAKNIAWSLGYLNQWYGTLMPENFGPLKLKEFRNKLIKINISRKVINKIVQIIRRCFKWAASEELIFSDVYRDLLTVDGLKKNRSAARETQKIMPIDLKHVYAVLPYTTHVVADMIQVQLLTGMRSGELVIMRPVDIIRDSDVWIYYPYKFKGDHREGANRSVAVGPKVQKILRPYLLRHKEMFCFTPDESESQRLGKKCTRKLNPRYDTKSFYHAVKKALRQAQKHIEVEDWTPHRLRHTAGTLIRAKYDVESARAVLGHSKISTTELYAEADEQIAIKIALKHG